ncbi:hypothetical protein OQA88_2272 [Cercophora sp. LCS_1]
MFSVDFMDELESMAQIAGNHGALEEQVDDVVIERWQNLFGYTYQEAAKKLGEHRASISQMVSNSHWDLVRAEKEAQGYDRETYEHSCQLLTSQSSRLETPAPTAKTPSNFLPKLEGPLSDVDTIKAHGCLSDKAISAPEVVVGTDDAGCPANFCIVDATTKQNILVWLSSAHPTFEPTLVRYSIARKALSSTSRFPTLGIDTTLPQYRLTSELALPIPTQDEYPVWYFFYGTLADPTVLRRLFALHDEAPLTYQPARILGGSITTWGGKYKALIDAPKNSVVEGFAFLVAAKEHEDALRAYETDIYEVVRCEIEMLNDKTRVYGSTFRFTSEA